MKINFDLDGVLYPWHSVIFEELRDSGVIDFDRSYWDFWKYDWNTDRIKPIISEMVNEVKYYIMSKPYPMAETVLNILSKNRHEIWYITQRPVKFYDATKIWLDAWHFPQTRNLIISDNKMVVINATYFDYFIDDRVEMLDKATNVKHKIVMTQPYNEDDTKYKRIDLLGELLDIIK